MNCSLKTTINIENMKKQLWEKNIVKQYHLSKKIYYKRINYGINYKKIQQQK